MHIRIHNILIYVDIDIIHYMIHKVAMNIQMMPLQK